MMAIKQIGRGFSFKDLVGGGVGVQADTSETVEVEDPDSLENGIFLLMCRVKKLEERLNNLKLVPDELCEMGGDDG